MFSPFLFQFTILTFFFTALPLSTLAQTSTVGPPRITNVTNRLTNNIDLFAIYDNGTFGSDCFAWDLTGDNLLSLDYTNASGSVELMAGFRDVVDADVVDIVAVADGFDVAVECIEYHWPPNLPPGQYHLRINNSVLFEGGVQNLSVRALDFNVTASSPIGCGLGRTPGSFIATPSPSSSSFTSVSIFEPYAGENFFLDDGDNSPQSFIQVQSVYRDRRNDFGRGISNLIIQVLDNSNGSVIATQHVSGPILDLIHLENIPLAKGGTYKLRVQYVNDVPDGLVLPGGLVTLTSGELNVLPSHTNCTDPNSVSSLSGPIGTSGSTRIRMTICQIFSFALAVTFVFILVV